MVKKYSELNDKQKLVFIKRNSIVGVVGFTPFIILAFFILSFVSALNDYSNVDSNSDDSNVFDSTTQLINDELPATLSETQIIQKYELKNNAVLILIFVMLFTYFGTLHIGFMIGDFIVNRLGFYTDIDLESAEKKLNKIKDSFKN